MDKAIEEISGEKRPRIQNTTRKNFKEHSLLNLICNAELAAKGGIQQAIQLQCYQMTYLIAGEEVEVNCLE